MYNQTYSMRTSFSWNENELIKKHKKMQNTLIRETLLPEACYLL